ncbi:tetratricopeptide (TPR) repeat protein [Agrobacterium vitis]|nr:tetratricopeptide (TPR) repeat protein [Agrobacterium vitis]MBE1439785.1 tetratricopeptide (TPR) repeat protein [Agrobacterium vitis]
MADTFEEALLAYKAGKLTDALTAAKAARDRQKDNAGPLHMLIGNIEMKLGDNLNAADSFLAAARLMPDQQSVFLKYAAQLLITAKSFDRLASIGLQAALLNVDDSDFLIAVGEGLLAAGASDALNLLLPKVDMRQGRGLQLAVNHYSATRQRLTLKALVDQRYAESPDDSFVAVNHFISCRSLLDFPAIRQWIARLSAVDDPFIASVLMRETALSRRLWCDDPALLARPDIDSLGSSRFQLKRQGPRRAIRPKGEKLRIGYVSSDFYAHATMVLLYDVLLAHDRQRFEVTLFCHSPADAAQAQKNWPPAIQANVVTVRERSDEEVVAEISRRGIDILVDLKGHTFGARLGIINGSDSPIKVSYLGFPGSVGGIELDYALTDPVVTPDCDASGFAEKLCRLPECYQSNGSITRALPQPSRRAENGLPDDRFVFASFNGSAKIMPETVDLWARVLVAVPDSLLWILCAGDAQQKNLTAEFARQGVAPQRILFASQKHYAEHINRLGLADLALDSFPYNGHTTTSDLLWAGVPVLTKKGKSFASRVSESLLRAIDLPELVAEDGDDFVAKAVRYATEKGHLDAVRARLAQNRAIRPLFDTERFTRHLEQAYEMMAERARAGLEPDHIDVPALPARVEPFL